MASGVGVKEECVTAFNEIKLGHKYRYIIYALETDLKNIAVKTTGEPERTYEDFVEELKSAEEANECRYAIYDADYKLSDGQQRSKLVFFLWSPDNAKIKQKMVYTSSKDALKKKLVGLGKEIQANDHGDLAWEHVMEVLLRNEPGQ